MKNPARRGISLVIALAFLASPLMATAVEASHSKYYGDRSRRGSYQQVSRKKHRGSYSGAYRTNRDSYCDSYRPRSSYRESYRSGHRHYDGCGHRHGGSGIGPFVGGLAVGAIIGSSVSSCPPPRRHVIHRRYVYHCDCCDYRYRSYDSWTEHLVVYHHVPDYDVRDYYPEYDGGYWEEY